MSRVQLAPFVYLALLILTSCTYSEERLRVSIDNAVANPNSHVFAVAVNHKRVQEPSGLINTFPNGGVLRIIEQKARIYIADAHLRTINLAAEIDNFGGIPNPTQVWVKGWLDGSVYFSLIGYEGDSWSGIDARDVVKVHYRVNGEGTLEQIDDLPGELVSARNSGPLGQPPFLRMSTGHTSIEVGIDGHPRNSARTARLWLDEATGQPAFSFAN